MALSVSRVPVQRACGPSISLRGHLTSDEVPFFHDLAVFIRRCPTRICRFGRSSEWPSTSSRAAARIAEETLGHSLAYRAGLEHVFEMETHLTGEPAVRPRTSRQFDQVAALVRAGSSPARDFPELLSDLRRGETGAMPNAWESHA